jgi:hypothetical protein
MAQVWSGSGFRWAKNLGWLLRHGRDVESVTVKDHDTSDCIMFARLRTGDLFVSTWEDRAVCRKWLKRPLFKGLPLDWFGEETTC